MSVEPIKSARSTRFLEDDREKFPDQFQYVEPKKSEGGYNYLRCLNNFVMFSEILREGIF